MKLGGVLREEVGEFERVHAAEDTFHHIYE